MTTCRKQSFPNRSVPTSASLRCLPESPSPTGEQPRGQPIRLLRLAQVIDMTGLGKTKIYELQAEGSFPMRVQITAHTVGWVEHEVQAWLANRVAARSVLTLDAGREILRRPSR